MHWRMTLNQSESAGLCNHLINYGYLRVTWIQRRHQEQAQNRVSLEFNSPQIIRVTTL